MKTSNCLSCVLVVLLSLGCNRPQLVAPFEEERLELIYETDGRKVFVVDDGNAYRETKPGEAWELVTRVFDPEEVQRSYTIEDGKTYRVSPDTQKRFEVLNELVESFEDVECGLPGLRELVSEQRLRWGSFTLQSPEAPTVADYVAHRQKMLAGQADFRDCRLEPTSEKVHSGNRSLKCVAPSKPDDMITCKASLSSPLVYFRNGDHFWFEAFYWAELSLPMTLIDLECEFVAEHPGIRLRIFDDETLGIELKALDKPTYRQPEQSRVTFPRGKWVRVRVHFALSTTDGKMEVWQDGQKVLDRTGMTLPFRSAIYNSLEVGISAHSNPKQPCVLYVDDLRCSSFELTE
ncbi:MAG: hypothetical protein IT423_18310 [Pirellulaceae bacterium]|nr:hypothetical protein [Pirellulaceae bacterium]